MKIIKLIIKKIFFFFFKLPFIERPLPKQPFCKRPLSNKEKYLELHNECIKNENFLIKELEKKSGYQVPEKWFNQLALVTQACIKKSNLNYTHGKILYSTLSKYINDFKSEKPLVILETGTARGFSAICMAKALMDQKAEGFITTIDIIPHNKKIFWNSISDFEGKKTRSELLSPWKKYLSRIIFMQGWTKSTLDRLGFDRVNFAFLDAQHTKDDVLYEFKYISKLQEKGDMIIFDDYTPGLFDGICEGIDFIESNYCYKIIRLNFDISRGYVIAIKS